MLQISAWKKIGMVCRLFFWGGGEGGIYGNNINFVSFVSTFAQFHNKMFRVGEKPRRSRKT